MRKSIVLVALVVAALAVFARYVDSRNPETRSQDELPDIAGTGQLMNLPAGSTWYDVSGPVDGAPVVLLHGFAIPSLIWEHNHGALVAAGFRVLRYDQYGRGYSARPMTGYGHLELAAQLNALLEQALPDTRPVLVCLSAGCPVAAAFLRHHGERAAGLIMVDPQMQSFVPARRAPLPLLHDLERYNDLDDLYNHVVTTYHDIADEYATQRQVEGYGRALDLIGNTQAGVDPMALYATLTAFGGPIVLVEGEKDRGQRRRPELMAALPSLTYVEIPDAAHGSNYHAPQAFNGLLPGILRDIVEAAQADGT